MLNLVLGLVAFGVALGLFRLCLPQRGKVRWFIGTEWEPYVAVGMTFGLLVSLGWAAAGIIGLFL